MKRALNWFPVALGILCLGLLAWQQRERAIRGQNDFVSIYTGAKLAGTPDLYSRPANLQANQSILGFQMEGTTYIRAPFYAILLKPLAALPYRVASTIFLRRRSPAFCGSCPVFKGVPGAAVLCVLEHTPAILLFRHNRDFAAGLVWSLCAFKFHLFLTLALLLANFEFLMAISLVCGLLASFHSGPAAGVLLLAVFVLAIASSTDAITRTLTALVVSPIPYLMGLSGRPYSAALPMLLIVWVIFAVRSGLGGVKFGVEKADLLRVSES